MGFLKSFKGRPFTKKFEFEGNLFVCCKSQCNHTQRISVYNQSIRREIQWLDMYPS